MKFLAIFHFLCVLLFILFQPHTRLQSHGFCAHTLVKQCDVSKIDTIFFICQKAVKREKICVPNCNAITRTQLPHKKVLKGGQSSIPWFVRFSCSEPNQHQIACSPLQEFYSVDVNKWIPAHQLKIGDYLQSYRGSCTVTFVEYVEKELKVYALEVEPPHTFFVGKEELLTHNMMLSESWIILAPAITLGSGTALSLGSGAAVGATFAPFLTPVVITAGLVLSGALGVLVKTICNDIIPTYCADVSNFFIADQKEQNKENIKEEADQSTSAGNPSGAPKKDDDKDKKKKVDAQQDAKEYSDQLAESAKKRGWENPDMPPKDDLQQLNHIFPKNKGGHDSYSDVAYQEMQDLVRDPKNYLGKDEFGNQWFEKLLQDGKQKWAKAYGKNVVSGGTNPMRHPYDHQLGILKPGSPTWREWVKRNELILKRGSDL